MRNTARFVSELDGILRLIGVVVVGALAALTWFIRSSGGSGKENLAGALLIALAPVVIAFPRLFRRRVRKPVDVTHVAFPGSDPTRVTHERLRSGSFETLARLRVAGAI